MDESNYSQILLYVYVFVGRGKRCGGGGGGGSCMLYLYIIVNLFGCDISFLIVATSTLKLTFKSAYYYYE